MNSIQDLNGFGSTSITFTDDRTPGPIFDRALPINQVVNVNQNDDHPIPEGINILEVIRPTDASVIYTIDVSSVFGSSVTWDTVPAGCFVTNPSPGVYSISGINSYAIWEQVKNPNYIPDPAFVGVFSYTGTISWNPGESVSWTVNATINDITNMTVPSDFYFLGGDSGAVTGNPEILDNYVTTWTVTATPSSLTGYDTLATAGSGGTSSFNPTTKVLTINGTKTQVNSHLNSMTFTSFTTSKSDFTLQYLAVNDTTNEGDVKIQAWYSTEYISAPRGDASYTYDTISAITDGPLITDANASGYGQYTMTVVPSDLAAVSTMSSTGRPGWAYNQTINCPQPQSPIASGARWPDAISFNSNSSYMAIGFQNKWTNFAPAVIPGAVLIYTKAGITFSQQAEINPTGSIVDSGTVAGFGRELAFSSDASTLAVGAPDEERTAGVSLQRDTGAIYVFTRSGTSWSQQTRLLPSDYRRDDFIGFPGRMAISSDGNTIVAGAPRTNSGTGYPDVVGVVFTWTRSAGTWTQQTTLSPGDGVATDAFGWSVAMNPAATTMAVVSYSTTSYPYNGSVYIYTGSSGTWTQQTKITSFDGAAAPIRTVVLSSDGNTMIAHASTTAYVFTRSAGVWTFSHKVTAELPIKLSDDASLLLTKNLIYKKISGVYTNYDTPVVTGIKTLSPDGLVIAGADQTATVGGYANAGAAYLYPTATIGTSWNSSTKTLTLTGNRSQVNEDVDTIQLTPTVGYIDNFILTYTLTTPAFNIDTREQDVIGGA